ncbi:MAG: tetratricopeptide repeat protein [Leptolyngbya sp.]|nr:tetratricopeptide repeat protein [Candidatus Melainabacteria bacterium]
MRKFYGLTILATAFLLQSNLTAFAEGDQQWVSECKAAQTAAAQSNFAQAEQLYQKALLEARKFGEEDSRVGITLGSLAGVYQAEGKYSNAEELYLKSIKIKEKSLGPDHPNVAVSYNNLATLYIKEGKPAKAVPLLRQALAIMEKKKGPSSAEVLMLKSNIAQLNSSSGKDSALSDLKQTLDAREKAQGSQSIYVAQSLNNLAEWYRLHNQGVDAEPLYRRSLALCEKLSGKENPYTCTVASNLGMLFLQEKKYALAEPLLLQSLQGREKTLGKQHSDYASSLRDLVQLYRVTNRTELASEYQDRADKIESANKR